MRVYYNDSDAFVCAWLRNLIGAGLIPAGDVDERPIEQVTGRDVAGYDQCHFFAGIGGWPYALQLAGWEGPAWTGSCPCQPLSGAGNRSGHADMRHLWPAFYRLIAECNPPVVFGEQVAGSLGREWFSAVRADLEGMGYACGAADLCAAMVGTPHNRPRLFFVADAHSDRYQSAPTRQSRPDAQRHLASSRSKREAERNATQPSSEPSWPPGPCCIGSIPRRANGISRDVEQIRPYGNAIVPQVAAAFVKAYMEIAP